MKAGRLGLLLLVALAGCGGAPAKSASRAPDAVDGIRHVDGRPPIALLARDGDPSASVAVAVLTEGVDPERGAEVPVALAALVEARLAATNLKGVSVVPGAEGFRVRALLPSAAEAQRVVTAITRALLDPVSEKGPENLAIEQKLSALARRPLPDPALDIAARCTGEPYATRVSKGPPTPSPVAAPLVEAWRGRSDGLGRVAWAVIGAPADIDAVAHALAANPVWPSATPYAAAPPKMDDLRVYDATADLPKGGARVSLLFETPEAERAVLAADTLFDSRSSLASRLSVLEPLARIRDVTGALHAGWGCLAVTLDLPPPDATADPPTRLATAVDVVRQETLSELANAKTSAAVVRRIVNQAGDPRDAAERLAYWTLEGSTADRAPSGSDNAPPRVSMVFGLSSGDTGSPAPLADRLTALRTELARTESSRHEPFGEVRVRVERGQAALWVLLASPCGTASESDSDAGVGALAAVALAARTRREAQDAQASRAAVEEWVTADGLGLLVRAAPLPGETSGALARRVAELAARGFGSSLADARDVNTARALLLSSSGGDDSRVFAVLAEAVSPSHPSWILPSGTTESLERASNDIVRGRLDALRAGPLRVAVLANQDTSQGDVVEETLSAFLPRRSDRPPACPAQATPPSPRPGTYAVETPNASSAEAWLAFALPALDAPARAAATTVAAALAAPHGLLERALGAGLARSWGAKVIGPPRATVLAVRIESAQGSLDAAVAEARVLFDRLRQEGLPEGDRALGLAEVARERLETSVDPKARLIALWRGEKEPDPESGADALRAFTARTMQNDALILVASRPPRIAVTKTP